MSTDEKALRQRIEVAIGLGNAGKVGIIEAVMRVIRPDLRTSEPVPVDLCITAFDMQYHREQNEYLATDQIKRIVKAVLDAAGVKYVE